jgi:hypothetical protein
MYFDASYVLMRNKIEKPLSCMLGHTKRGKRLVWGCPNDLLLT